MGGRSKIKVTDTFNKKASVTPIPAVLLLLLVYLLFIPLLLSYDHAWVQPEEFSFKTVALTNGPALQWDDLKVGLDCQGFENAPRTTRPFSSYFEILDTKFRCWLWHYMLPLPSLSLTWIFSFIGAPLLLYRLLRYWKVGMNTAMAMTAFYLMTPAVMSCAVMLFHPGKPMANFFILFCLYQASRLQEEFLDQGKPVPAIRYICFWVISALSFYWDETMWVIIPALLILFPRVAAGRKMYLWAWLALPFVAALFYFKVIPWVMILAGYNYADILQFKESLLPLSDVPSAFFRNLAGNAKNLGLDTMGIMVPDIWGASPWIKICGAASLAAWGVIGFYILKAKWRWDGLVFFLGGLILFFNLLMTLNSPGIWGPYYYGTFWSIFFVIWLALKVERSAIGPVVLTACFFPIFLSMFCCFGAVNTVYKKYHYYPYDPNIINLYFAGQKSFFGPNATPQLSGDELKGYIRSYWLASKHNPPSENPGFLPRELYWLILELRPEVPHVMYDLRSTDTNIPALIFNPDLAEAYNDRGLFYYNQGDFTQALADFNKAIATDPKYEVSYINRELINEKQNNPAQSLSDFNKSHGSINNRAKIYNDQGIVDSRQGRIAQALSNYNKAIELEPDYAEAYNNRGNTYKQEGDLTGALSDFNKALKINPSYDFAYANRGNAYAMQDDLSDAISDLTKAIELRPDFAGFYNDRGFFYAREGNFIKAVSDYTKSIAINPAHAETYANRAVGYYMLKEYDQARGDTRKAQELGGAVNPELIKDLKQAPDVGASPS